MDMVKNEFEEVVSEFHNLKLANCKVIEDQDLLVKSKEEEVFVLKLMTPFKISSHSDCTCF
jgi:hypothetical protein